MVAGRTSRRAAPTLCATATGVAEGQTEHRRFASGILGNERDVDVYTHANCRPDGAGYALLVVGVLVGNVNRFKELACNPMFSDFLHEELVPWARKEYHATSDSQRTTIAGSSFGGLTAACTAIRHAETFGNVLSQSGSFNREPTVRAPAGTDRRTKAGELAGLGWVAGEIARQPRLAVRFYLNAGLFETMADRKGNTKISANRQLRDVLRSKGYEVLHVEFAGGHSPVNWRGTFADGLIFLMQGR